jgi:hypothetical protein
MSGSPATACTEKEIQDLMEGFEMLWMGEENEEPVNLYIVFRRKIATMFVMEHNAEHMV